MTICLSHGGPTMYRAEQPSNRLLVGTVKGVAFLERASAKAQWRETHRALEQYHVVGLALEPRSNTIIATMHDGGLSVSEDDGKTWERRTHGIHSNNVYCIAIACRGNKVQLYAGTEPAHLYVSADLGKNWRELANLRTVPSVPKWTFPAPPHNAHVINVSVHPHDPDIVYACIEQGGLLKSIDGGETWRELQGFNDDVHRVLIPESAPNRLILPTGYGFYVSDDAGETWKNISELIKPIGYPDPMVINPLRDNVMFVAGGSADPYHWMQTKCADPRVARSMDGGTSWQVVDGGMPGKFNASFEAMAIEAWSGGSSIYLGNTDGEVWISDDDGNNWRCAVSEVGAVSKTIHHTILRQDLSFDKHERP